uniref:peroxisomal membrane protein 11C isoform X3 n=1 Tax=Callithrix jacchus TaxID=9483 RepID=UPI00159E73C6|nr:peroxisomal membrane protein 11C isoform X3 [Callithrix jacchus]
MQQAPRIIQGMQAWRAHMCRPHLCKLCPSPAADKKPVRGTRTAAAPAQSAQGLPGRSRDSGRAPPPGAVRCRHGVAMASFSGLASALESYRGRDRLEEDAFVRWVSVLGNLADQLYYPCEHVAWAAETRVLHVDSSQWWTLSTALWALSLLLGVARSLWVLLKLRQRLRSPTAPFTSPLARGKRRAMEAQMQSEMLSLLSNLADLANAVHWLPRGVLWAGRFPLWLVGLLGTISSLLSIYQAVRAGGQAELPPPDTA